MAYGKKESEHTKFILERAKDLSALVPGNPYHLRKKINQVGNVITDEVHDIVLKEVVENNLISEDGSSFLFTEFEIFFRR
jgi:hypothetical protein